MRHLQLGKTDDQNSYPQFYWKSDAAFHFPKVQRGISKNVVLSYWNQNNVKLFLLGGIAKQGCWALNTTALEDLCREGGGLESEKLRQATYSVRCSRHRNCSPLRCGWPAELLLRSGCFCEPLKRGVEEKHIHSVSCHKLDNLNLVLTKEYHSVCADCCIHPQKREMHL